MSTIANLLIKVGVDVDEAQAKLSGFGAKAKSGFQKALIPSVAVMTALGVAAKGAADEASDLGEAQNAVTVVFGKSSGIITDFAKGAARSAGLSMLQANNAVVPLGASLQNYGLSAKDAATTSVMLAKRAADMASVFNTDVPTALDAVKAGLRGEADPLEKFGVGLSDAAVRAKAVEMGLAKTTAGVDEHGKMQARVALIMEQTNKLQGDFVKTSGSAANAARINAAEADNLKASFGQGLLPVMTTFQAVLGKVLGFMGQHQTATKVAVVVVASLAATVLVVNGAIAASSALTLIWTGITKAASAATKVWTAATWLLNAAQRAMPLVLIITLIAALAAGIVIAYRRSDTFRSIVQGAFGVARTVVNAVKVAIDAVVDAIRAAKDSRALQLIAGVFTGHFLVIKTAISAVSTVLGAVTGAVRAVKDSAALDAIGGAFRTAFGAAKAAVGGVVTAVNALISAVRSAISLVARLAGNSARAHAQARAFASFGGAGGGIPRHADGGVFTRPHVGLVAEAGPEAIVPLNNPRRAAEVMREAGLSGGGGPTVRIDTMVVQDATDIDRVASRLGRSLIMAGA